MRIFSTTIAATCLIAGLSSVTYADTEDEAIAAVRAATEKYQDINIALAEGFVQDPSGECASSPAGGMGVHYLNMAKLKITGGDPQIDGEGTHTDFMEPAILMYEPQADGSMMLVGVENLVFQKAWHAAGNAEAPSFAHNMWDSMADDLATDMHEAHGFAPHYDRHVWAFRDNPEGVFAPFNPNVSCEFHKAG